MSGAIRLLRRFCPLLTEANDAFYRNAKSINPDFSRFDLLV
jgi:hypothetical protein